MIYIVTLPCGSTGRESPMGCPGKNTMTLRQSENSSEELAEV